MKNYSYNASIVQKLRFVIEVGERAIQLKVYDENGGLWDQEEIPFGNWDQHHKEEHDKVIAAWVENNGLTLVE